MATAPKVQSIAEIMTELDPANDKQRSLIQQTQAGLGEKYAGQQSGLDAKKAAGFNTINNQATGRGMSFSGIPIDEQATYLSTEYMPAVANLKTSQNAESAGLNKDLADIYTNQYNTAYGTLQSQNSALNNWNLQVMQQEASAAEAEKNRQFEAEQKRLDRNLSASQFNATNAKANETMSPDEAALAILTGAVSSGAEVTSNVFQNARDAYRLAGGDTKKFASDYWKYVPKASLKKDGWKSYYYG